MSWAVRFLSDNQRDGRFYTYEMVEDFAQLGERVKDKQALEVYAVRAFPSTVAETVFKKIAGEDAEAVDHTSP